MTLPGTLAPRWLRPSEVAQQLGVKVEKVLAWIKRGELRGINVGDGAAKGRFRVSPADLEIFLASRAVQPPVKPARRRRADPAVTEYF